MDSDGRNLQTVQSGPEIGSNYQKQTHSRETECTSRSTKSKGPDPSDRMVDPSISTRVSVVEVGETTHRPICNQIQPQTACIFKSSSRQNNSRSGHSGENIYSYAYPPPGLIRQVINMILKYPCKIILIAPFWPDQPWFL